jgi:hypothetical protein
LSSVLLVRNRITLTKRTLVISQITGRIVHTPQFLCNRHKRISHLGGVTTRNTAKNLASLKVEPNLTNATSRTTRTILTIVTIAHGVTTFLTGKNTQNGAKHTIRDIQLIREFGVTLRSRYVLIIHHE